MYVHLYVYSCVFFSHIFFSSPSKVVCSWWAKSEEVANQVITGGKYQFLSAFLKGSVSTGPCWQLDRGHLDCGRLDSLAGAGLSNHIWVGWLWVKLVGSAKGVFLVTTKNVLTWLNVFFAWANIFRNFNHTTREWASEWASPWTEPASKASMAKRA